MNSGFPEDRNRFIHNRCQLRGGLGEQVSLHSDNEIVRYEPFELQIVPSAQSRKATSEGWLCKTRSYPGADVSAGLAALAVLLALAATALRLR
jgi:hypothetical protein